MRLRSMFLLALPTLTPQPPSPRGRGGLSDSRSRGNDEYPTSGSPLPLGEGLGVRVREAKPRGSQARLVLSLATLLLSACTVGPDYRAPNETAPAVWTTEAEEGLVADAEILTEWWRTLDDRLLESLIEEAARSNHDLRIARLRVREARALARIASSQGKPSVGVEVDYTRAGISEEGVGLASFAIEQGLVEREDDFFQAGFDASWELDVFGGVRRATQAATTRAEAADEGRRDVLRTVLAEVARGYVELRGAQRRLAVANDNLRIQQQSLELVENRVKTGLARPLEQEQARAQLGSTRSTVPVFEAQIHAAAHRLGVLVGEQPGALLDELTAAAPVPATPEAVPIGLPSELLRRRPDVRRGERQRAAAAADIGVAVADLYPRFFFAGGASGRPEAQTQAAFHAILARHRAGPYAPPREEPRETGRLLASVVDLIASLLR